MFKKIAILLFSVAVLPLFSQSQKVGFIDSDLILNKMPEYKSAQKTLDDLAAQWQAKDKEMQAELDQMYKDYKGAEVLLTEDAKKAKEDAIVAKEQELYKFREDKFGTNGELFKKRQELIKPVQDKLYDAVQKVAKKEGYAFIFDKAGGVMMLYADAKYDKTTEVMEELGIVTDNATPDKKN